MKRKKARYSESNIVRFVRSLDGEFYLPREVAGQLQCSLALVTYIARAHSDKRLGPSHQASYGAVRVNLYTPERIEAIRQHIMKTRAPHGRQQGRRGVPKMWSAAEYAERVRALDRARYYRRRAASYESEGQHERAARAQAKADQLHGELVTAAEERRKSRVA